MYRLWQALRKQLSGRPFLCQYVCLQLKFRTWQFSMFTIYITIKAFFPAINSFFNSLCQISTIQFSHAFFLTFFF